MDMRQPETDAPREMEAGAPSAKQLEKINRFTRRPLKAEEVFVFPVTLCDNEIDRDGERFPEESLAALETMFVGKTGVFDHNPKAKNQSARIFETELVKEGTANSLGESYCYLKAWAYMLRSEKNADLILEIDGGIKKEVSVGCAVERVACSVCGKDRKKEACGHRKGEVYGGAVCHHLLLEPTDAYEWSFVAVPAQKNAGVTKRHGGGEAVVRLEKWMEEDGDAPLQAAQVRALRKQCRELWELAEAGKAYVKELRRDVVRLALLAQPELAPGTAEDVTRKMSVEEMRAFQKAFAASAAERYPVAPQLARRREGAGEATDAEFKI